MQLNRIIFATKIVWSKNQRKKALSLILLKLGLRG
jgi:hypothetical protein